MLLDVLKFVQGAVSKKDLVAALTHFHIKDGFIRGGNGKLSLCSPIPIDLEAAPKATPFIKAIQSCEEETSLHLTPTGRLSIKSGKFKAYLDCTTDPYPDSGPEGVMVEVTGSFLPALKVLAPFMAEDASRPWARGILFKGQSIFATNNIILMEYWLGFTFPSHVNVPAKAIAELLRIGEEPTHLQVAENSITFHYTGGRWLKSQLSSIEWPDITKILDHDMKAVPLDPAFFKALETLLPFASENDRVYLNSEAQVIATSTDDGAGAQIEYPVQASGCYNGKMLFTLKGVAKQMDFTRYPKPSLFTGDRLRGAIIGMRM